MEQDKSPCVVDIDLPQVASADWSATSPQAGAFHVLPAFDTKSTGLAYAVAAGAVVAARFLPCWSLSAAGLGLGLGPVQIRAPRIRTGPNPTPLEPRVRVRLRT